MSSPGDPPLDCLVLGFYDYPFADYVEMVRGMGARSGAFQDLSLAFIEVDGQPMRALDVLTHFRRQVDPLSRQFHNADFLWPAIAYLTRYLRERGLSVDYVNLPHLEIDDLRRRLARSVRTVAITTTVYVSPHPILALIEEVRRQAPQAKIVVGGPYVVNQAALLDPARLAALFAYLGADIYVLGREGEASLAALLDGLRNGRPAQTIPNLAIREADNGFVFTPSVPENNSLEGEIIDYTAFAEREPLEFISLRTAKSCPFSCAFCGFPQRAGEYRYLAVADVRRQLDALAVLDSVSTVSFLDDTFNVPKRRFKDILRMMIEAGYGFQWNCFYRADMGDDETIALMAEAGCEGVFLGVESASDRMLAIMNKSARRHHYEQAIAQFRACEITTYASIIVGFPGETDTSVRETITFLEEARPDYYRAQLWYADPLTPIWRDREYHEIEGTGFAWRHATMSVQEACSWIDRIFVEVRGSTWLPQFGFEPWSLYYLRRKGFSLPKIKTFVECFNALIRHRILTGDTQPPATLLESLRRICQ